MQDLKNNIALLVAIAPQVVGDGSSLVSGAIDTLGHDSATFAIALGTLADADATWSVTVKEGDTATQAEHTAVADVDLIGTEAEAGIAFDDDNGTKKIGYSGGKRYISIEIDNVTTNSGAAPMSVMAILGHPRHAPAA